MTKTLLFLSAALVCAQGANAQAQNNATFNPFKQAGTLPATAAKTTANASRLIAVTGRTFYTGNLEIQDSAHCCTHRAMATIIRAISGSLTTERDGITSTITTWNHFT